MSKEVKMLGSILRPREITPQRLIYDLIDRLDQLQGRCRVCNRVATRTGKLSAIIIGDPSTFCDEHSFVNVPRYESVKAVYEDMSISFLIRQAREWLDKNQVEEKT